MSEAEKGNGTKILFTILFAIAFTGFMVFVLTSDMFIVRNIEVKNTTKLDIDKIKKDSGIIEGRNIFLQRYFKAAVKLKENARIQEAKIYPVFPNKVEIYIEERNENYQISDETPLIFSISALVISSLYAIIDKTSIAAFVSLGFVLLSNILFIYSIVSLFATN